MASFPTKFWAPGATPCWVARRRRNGLRKKRALRKPLLPRGTDTPRAVIAYDIGGIVRECGAGPHFRKSAARGDPFQTPQRLQDAGKTRLPWRKPCAQSDILSAAARSRALRAGSRTYWSR